MRASFKSLFANCNHARNYRSAVMADAPIAYWRLNESSGTTAFDLGTTGSMEYVASPTLGEAGPMAGSTGVLFDGTTQYAWLATSPVSAYPVTIEAWIKLVNTGVDGQFIQIANNSVNNRYLAIGYNTVRGWDISVRNNIDSADTNGFSIAAGGTGSTNWTHLVAVFASASLCRLYVNGTLVDSDFHTTSFPTGINRVGIGRQMDSIPLYSNATISDVAIYTSALTASQIAAHYAAAGY